MARKTPTKANASKKGSRPRTKAEKALEAAESIPLASSPGRPSKYTEELAKEICDKMSSGLSLRSICKGIDVDEHTVRMWAVNDVNGFAAKYAKAREAQMEALAEDLVEISDDKTGDVNRDRLRVDTRKWIMARIAPKKYGDKVTKEITGGDGGAVKLDVTGMSDDKLAAIEAALVDLIGGTERSTSEGEGGEESS